MNWQIIKILSHSPYARMTIIVPLIGWILVKDRQLSEFLAHYFNYSAFMGISWQIYMLHIGLSLFGIGVFCYMIFAPDQIKNFIDVNDYKNKIVILVTRSELLLMFNKINDSQKFAVAKEAKQNFSNIEPDIFDIWIKVNKERVYDILYFDYFNAKSSRPKARIVTSIILFAGIVLMLVPSVYTLLWSILNLLKIMKDIIF